MNGKTQTTADRRTEPSLNGVVAQHMRNGRPTKALRVINCGFPLSLNLCLFSLHGIKQYITQEMIRKRCHCSGMLTVFWTAMTTSIVDVDLRWEYWLPTLMLLEFSQLCIALVVRYHRRCYCNEKVDGSPSIILLKL
ncbi:hypothetical protein BDW66DRAFT_50393 [Aspergillus desertorum]